LQQLQDPTDHYQTNPPNSTFLHTGPGYTTAARVP